MFPCWNWSNTAWLILPVHLRPCFLMTVRSMLSLCSMIPGVDEECLSTWWTGPRCQQRISSTKTWSLPTTIIIWINLLLRLKASPLPFSPSWWQPLWGVVTPHSWECRLTQLTAPCLPCPHFPMFFRLLSIVLCVRLTSLACLTLASLPQPCLCLQILLLFALD